MTLDEAILRLVEEQEITGQSVFLSLLKHSGHEITQPTLSRHVKKLGIQKITGRYQRVEARAEELPVFTLIEVPPNLITIHTRPGYAQPLAVKLDHQKITGVVGTIAGDDTVLITITPPHKLKPVAEAIESLFSHK